MVTLAKLPVNLKHYSQLAFYPCPVWHVFSRDFREVLPGQLHVHPQLQWAIPAFAFPAAASVSNLPVTLPMLPLPVIYW